MPGLKVTLLLGILFLPATVLAADVHPEVQAALDWQLPVSDCKFNIPQSGVGSGMDRKYKKAMKKFGKCVGKYKKGLVEQQKDMMALAQHGLTQEQADIIMSKMWMIKKILKAEGAKPRATPPSTNAKGDVAEVDSH